MNASAFRLSAEAAKSRRFLARWSTVANVAKPVPLAPKRVRYTGDDLRAGRPERRAGGQVIDVAEKFRSLFVIGRGGMGSVEVALERAASEFSGSSR